MEGKKTMAEKLTRGKDTETMRERKIRRKIRGRVSGKEGLRVIFGEKIEIWIDKDKKRGRWGPEQRYKNYHERLCFNRFIKN